MRQDRRARDLGKGARYGVHLSPGPYNALRLKWLDTPQSEPLHAPHTIGGTQETTELLQQRIPRRLQQELIRARKQLEEEHNKGIWSRLFGA
jgi:hypothetical protein